jgi:two-component system chemotaxis response regulator CheB
MTIKVCVVDDSPLIRRIMTEIIDKQPDMKVVGSAPNPLVAREVIKETNPDVLTLDIEMPKMDGLDFLERLMRLRPMPVVMVSSLTQRGSDITMRALEIGAVDFLAKPGGFGPDKLDVFANSVVYKIRAAVAAKVQRNTGKLDARIPGTDALPLLNKPAISQNRIIVIGASTGGTEAIRTILQRMPVDCPGILIAQHMPEGFTRSFADRLNSLCKIAVKEAIDGERIMPGHAYVAPGNYHLLVQRMGSHYVTRTEQSDPVNLHRPSVEVLFHSAAAVAGRNTIGVMLTGMGKDGAKAMLKMREAGSHNIVQDEATSVVFGMPREAINLGAAHVVSPVQGIAQAIMRHLAT